MKTNNARKEYIYIGIWIVTFFLVSLLPYMVGYLNSSRELAFSGILSYWPGDTYYHLSWPRQLTEDHWLLEDKYNGLEAQTRLLFNSLFLILAKTSKYLGLPLITSVHLWRAIFTVVLLLVIYFFVSFFITEFLWKWFALLLISCSSGFGWLVMLGFPDYFNTTDLLLIESITFWFVRWEVVVTPTVLLLLLTFLFAAKFLATQENKYKYQTAITTLLLTTVHPHDSLTVYVVLGAYTCIHIKEKKSWQLLLATILISSPAHIYNLFILQQEPIFWEYVKLQDPFTIMGFIMGYGILIPPCLYGIKNVLGQPQFRLLLLWLFCAFILLFVPIPPAHQVFLVHGLHIPICIFAAIGLSLFLPRICASCKKQMYFLIIFLVFSSLTNIFVFINELAMVAKKEPVFIYKDLQESLEYADLYLENKNALFIPLEIRTTTDWLAKNSEQSNVVLAPTWLSEYIPYLSGNRVFAARFEQTVDFPRKAKEIKAFFNPNNRELARREFLLKNGIDYIVVWAKPESPLRQWIQTNHSVLQVLPVYQNKLSIVFSVRK